MWIDAIEAGDHVHVYRFGRWRVGRVLKTGRTRVFVEYLTPHISRPIRASWFRIAEVRRRQ